MRSKQTMFFSTLSDIKSVIEDLETLINVQYYKTGLFDSRHVFSYKSLLLTPDIGYMKFGDWNRANNFLVMADNLSLGIEDVPQRKGGIKYAVDQLINQQSITIKTGGVYTGAPNVLVAGRVATASEDLTSLELYKLYSSKVRKHFKTKIEGFYIGSEALELLKSGWRLVLDEGRSPLYDLKLPEQSAKNEK